MKKTIKEKILYSFLCALIFIIASHPKSYKIISGVTDNQCPNALTHIKHTIFFAILAFIIMFIINLFKSTNRKSIGILLKYTFYSSLMFYLISNKEMYQITNKIFGNNISSKDGCATAIGVLVHAIVYMLLKFLVMYFPKDCDFIEIPANLLE